MLRAGLVFATALGIMLSDTQQLLARLAAADRAHQRETGALWLLRSVKYLCGAVLGLFALDVVVHLTAGWRLALGLALLAALGGLGAIAWHGAFVRRNRLEHIARLLETRDAALGSRLINLLQLQAQTEDASLAPRTRELARQAVAGYAAGLQALPLESLARTDRVARQAMRVLWVVLGFVGILAAGYRVSEVELARYADPFGDHPPYSFTHLQIVQPGPAGTNVFYDQGTVVRVKAGGHLPKEVWLSYFPKGHPEQTATLPMFGPGGAGFEQLVGHIQAPVIVVAHTKDHVSESKQVPIGVILTPQLTSLFVRISPPPYTGLAPQEKPYTFKDVPALEGSEVRFRIQSNRPLREGMLELFLGDRAPQTLALSRSGEKEVSGAFAATDSGRMRFAVRDQDGLPSQGDFEGPLTVTHDLPPTVAIVNPDRDAFVALDFKLQVQVEASDDYGLREIRLHRGVNGTFATPLQFNYTNLVREARETLDLDFGRLGIQPGDVLSLFAEAVDTAPQPHLSRSRMLHLQVISVEDYNNFLREQSDLADAEAKYNALNQELQAMVEQQKALSEAAGQLSRQVAKAGTNGAGALAPQFDRLVAQQNELNDRLNRHAERMEHFVREHPVYDVETDLQAQLRQLADRIRQSTRTNDAATRAVAQRSSPPGAARHLTPELPGDLRTAAEEQVARLSGVLGQTDQVVVKTLDEMDQMQELIKDFNQFESLYHVQQDLAQQAQAYNRAGLLEREDQLALKELAATENEVAAVLSQLPEKLRQDAKAAEKLFPKAAQSGRDLADQIGEHRLPPLAEQATGEMLAANGEQAFELAERLGQEMAKLFSQCQGSGNCPSSDELDQYLRLHQLGAQQNFAQMLRCRKFGLGLGRGRAGQGEEGSARSGYAMMDGSSKAPVLGNETSAPHGSQPSRQSSRFGQGAGALAGQAAGSPEKPDALKNLNPVNRQSGAVATETTVDQYRDVVENYFKTITRPKEAPAHDH